MDESNSRCAECAHLNESAEYCARERELARLRGQPSRHVPLGGRARAKRRRKRSAPIVAAPSAAAAAAAAVAPPCSTPRRGRPPAAPAPPAPSTVSSLEEILVATCKLVVEALLETSNDALTAGRGGDFIYSRTYVMYSDILIIFSPLLYPPRPLLETRSCTSVQTLQARSSSQPNTTPPDQRTVEARVALAPLELRRAHRRALLLAPVGRCRGGGEGWWNVND